MIGVSTRIQEETERPLTLEEDPVDYWAPHHHAEPDRGFGGAGVNYKVPLTTIKIPGDNYLGFSAAAGGAPVASSAAD